MIIGVSATANVADWLGGFSSLQEINNVTGIEKAMT